MSYGLKSCLPDNLTCPLCDQEGDRAWGNIAHFDRFVDIVVERDRRWLLGFVCEEHHHWVVDRDRHSGGTWIPGRTAPCPGPAACLQARLERAANPGPA